MNKGLGYIRYMDAVIIRMIDLPYKVDGFTVKDSEGDYNVYINARHSDGKRVETFRHELDHIKRGHFYRSEPVSVLEYETKTSNR